MSLKQRLATVGDGTIRYRMAKGWWKESSIRQSKACKFYWWILPTSLLGYVGAGIIWGIAIGLNWIVGRVPTFFKDKGGRFGENYADKHFAYPYKYSPHKGGYRRIAPWQILAPLVALSGLGYLLTDGILLTFVSQVWDWLFDHRYALAAAILVLFGLFVIGNAARSRKAKQMWDRICPPLQVQYQQPTSEQETS